MSDVHCPARLIVTAPGRLQARELAQGLTGERVAGVVSSDLSGTVQTAEIAAGVLGLPVEVHGGLHDPTAGETDDDAAARVLAVLDDVADRFRGETVLVVSHPGAIRATVGRLGLGSPPELADARDAPGLSTYVLERDADGWRFGL